MKRRELFILPLAVAAGVAMTSPALSQSRADLSDRPAVAAFYRAIATKNVALFDEALADDWDDTPLAPGQGPGREGFKPIAEGLFQAFPDLTTRVDDVVAQGEKVVVRTTLAGTHRGTFAGATGGGQRFEIQAIDIHEIGPDGRIARSWHTEDWLTALYQLGLLPLQTNGVRP